jgi:serine/threonine protein kinase
LKPENIVIDESGHLKLTDFGLSKENVDDDYLSTSFIGSHAYLAPEVIKEQPHGKSIDWYGLGALLYEFLVGVPPYIA